MLVRKDKPKVFLSHSKKDVEFIKQLYSDLVRCQIEPWLDEFEIRHGQPWLSAIFEDGMPACDSVLVYLTENSINSDIVKKEIDAGFISKLNDNTISFLPYVNKSENRTLLRMDLQTLQTLEWNKSNYTEVLPVVVSEIWRSFMERKITSAINNERVSRLEAELELERIRSMSGDSPFSKNEVSDFEFIYSKLNRDIHFKLYGNQENDLSIEGKFKVNLLSFCLPLSLKNNRKYERYSINATLNDIGEAIGYKHLRADTFPKIAQELLTYGLIKSVFIPPSQVDDRRSSRGRSKTEYVFQDKIDRFKYWVEFTFGETPKPVIRKCE